MRTTAHVPAPHVPAQRTPDHDGHIRHRPAVHRFPLLLSVITNTGHLEYVSLLLTLQDTVQAWCLNTCTGALDRRHLLTWLAHPAPQTELADTQLVLACDAGTGITLTLPGVTRHRITQPARERILNWLRTDIP